MAAATGTQGIEARPQAAIWMGLAALAALGLAGATLAMLGTGSAGLLAALRLTARLGFLLFWPSYVAGPLTTLFGPRWRPLGRYARVLGMAFSTVLAVHLTLVAWYLWTGAALPLRTFVIFGAGALCAYGLLLASIDRVRKALGDALWRRVQSVGTGYILFAFAYDFLLAAPKASAGFALAYVPFDILVVLAAALRLLAWRARSRA